MTMEIFDLILATNSRPTAIGLDPDGAITPSSLLGHYNSSPKIFNEGCQIIIRVGTELLAQQYAIGA